MIYAQPSASFEATVSGQPTGLTGTIGVRILDNAGATSSPRVTAGIAEYPAGSGFYTITLTAPSTAGQYSVFWDTGTVSPTTTVAEDLVVSSTAPAASVPSGSDLTTVAAVRSFMQKPAGDTGQDTEIQNLVTRASGAIMHYTEREFAPATSTPTARTFEYKGGGWLDVAPYDIRTVTQIRLDTDESSPTTLTSTEYRLYPYPARHGVYTALRLGPYLVHSRARWQQRLVEITGTWGFATVPEDVAHACIVTVAMWLRRDVTPFESTFSIDEGRLERPAILPSSVIAALAPYKREAYA